MEFPENKMQQIFGGTWDSNPGPIAQWPARLPIQPTCLFVNEIHNKYYIENSIIMLENKKNKREI